MAAESSVLTPTLALEPAQVLLDNDHSPRLVGDWTVQGIHGLGQQMAGLNWPQAEVVLDGSTLRRFDTAGALSLIETILMLRHQGRNARVVDLSPGHQALLDLVLEHTEALEERGEGEPKPDTVAALGRHTVEQIYQANGFLSFVGETAMVLLRSLLDPRRIRWRALFAIVQSAGLNAMPIIGLLTFLIGVVIAYQGGVMLSTYGANVFIVELVSIAMVRELAPLLAAIIVAGRTGSAFTAQIGTMRVTEEVDALRTIGINPFEVLVLPKMLGLMITLPLLSIYADMTSVFGGMVVAKFVLGVDFTVFVDRLPTVVSLISYSYGLAKTPIFAIIIALVGCYQGFQVSGGADSVGRQTTQSVVQAIFLVIIANAIFAVSIGGAGLYAGL